MPTTLTETSTFDTPIVVPASGDARTAASVDAAFQKLANRVLAMRTARMAPISLSRASALGGLERQLTASKPQPRLRLEAIQTARGTISTRKTTGVAALRMSDRPRLQAPAKRTSQETRHESTCSRTMLAVLEAS